MPDDDEIVPVVPGQGQPARAPASDVGGTGGAPAPGAAEFLGPAAALTAAASLVANAGRFGVAIIQRQVEALADRAGQVTFPVVSSCISSITYSITSGEMEVTFVDGSVYYYPGTPMSQFLAFLNARSKGAYYNQYLRGRDSIDYMGKKKGWKMPLR